MKLNKRECGIKIRLTPCGADFLRVHFRIGSKNYYFYPSCVMGDQFSSFLTALYCLYNEGHDCHRLHRKLKWKRTPGIEPWKYPNEENDKCYYKSIPIIWDEEGSYIKITLSRRSKTEEGMPAGVPDPIKIAISHCGGNPFEYTVDGRDLCYAVAKGYTEAIKKYGFQGYLRSSGSQYLGDSFEMDEFLFVKAYALDAMEVRNLKLAWRNPNGWEQANASSFKKEMELLMFDM